MKIFRYTAIQNYQRPPENGAPGFLIFCAPAGQVYEWAAIERHTPQRKLGPQRLEKPAKVSEVRRFFERNAKNTIPTALIVSLDLKSSSILETGTPNVVTIELEFDETSPEKPGTVIDGQHRLLGAAKFDPELPLNIVALLNPTSDETAFQFLVVNNKASRVSRNHLLAVVSKYDQDELSNRLNAIRMSIGDHLNFIKLADEEENSPFRGLIKWSNNTDDQGFIAPNALESSIAYLKQKKIPELEEDEAVLLGFFLAIWTTVKENWEDCFNKDSHLLEKVPIICLTQFIAEDLVFEYDKDQLRITDFAAVSESINRILKCLNPKLWKAKWVNKSLDTATGRGLLLDSLTQIRRNINADRPWYSDVGIVDLQGDLL